MLAALKARGYRFTVPGNDTIRTVRLRPLKGRPDLRDIFGWSRGFKAGDVDAEILALMRAGGVLRRRGTGLASGLRVASLGETLFLHSAFPPTAADAVFFGPDTYRFAGLIDAEQPGVAPRRILDIGAGSGAGGLHAAAHWPGAELALTDVNPRALRLARINALHAGAAPTLLEGEGLAGAKGPFDLIVANPPFIIGSGGRTYRDGGEALGAAVSLDWTRAALAALAPGGRFILYSGAAIVGGRDPLHEAIEEMAAGAGASLRYREIDPDIFGGLLLKPDYWRVERLAAVGAVFDRPR